MVVRWCCDGDDDEYVDDGADADGGTVAADLSSMFAQSWKSFFSYPVFDMSVFVFIDINEKLL